MAADNDREFKFRKVNILADKLGRGAYGVVHKAKCDELMCAAKYMHPTFFVENEGQHFNDTVANQFKKECELLSRLKHPNIVQYLGTHEQPGINTVILLMEKLDCSLYAFIQDHKTSPIPFYQEVNISRDVACALDFLHVNGIHHRDLSCKNILLLGNLRAKVSDFGQSKLRDPKCGYSSNSPCPGNIVYMPPETLKVPPDFADTLDEFSLGVVMIQIMNRQEDPRPTELQRDGPTPGMFYYVNETERRKDDIALCDPANPLLPLAIGCISNDPLERTPAEKVCAILSLLQTTSPYINSVNGMTDVHGKREEVKKESNNSDDFCHIEFKPDDSYYTEKIDQLIRDNEDKENLLKGKTELLEIRDRQLIEKHQDIEMYEKTVAEKDNVLKEKDNHIQQKEKIHSEEIAAKNAEIFDKDQQLSDLRELLSKKEVAFIQKEQEHLDLKDQLRKKEDLLITLRDQQSNSDERFSKLVAELELVRAELVSKETTAQLDPVYNGGVPPMPLSNGYHGLSQSTTNISNRPSQPASISRPLSQPTSISCPLSQPTSVSRPLSQSTSVSRPPPLSTNVSHPLSQPTSVSRPLSHTFYNPPSTASVRLDTLEQMELIWKTKKRAPESFQPQNSMAAGHMDKVYVSHCNYNRAEGKVFEYNLSTDTWKKLPVVNKSEFSLAIIHNNVVAVGGSSNLRKSGSVLWLKENKWIKAFNDIPTPRSFPTCIVVGNRFLMVAGGEVNGEPISIVEILDVQLNRWHYVRSLPARYLSRMTASAKGSLVYLMGGFEEGALSKRVFSVDVHDLVMEVERRTGKPLWKELPQLPVSGATAATFQNRLLAVGGYNSSTKDSSFFIYEFDYVKNLWKAVGRLPRSFSRGLVTSAKLSDNEVLTVVGGNEKNGVSTVTNIASIAL